MHLAWFAIVLLRDVCCMQTRFSVYGRTTLVRNLENFFTLFSHSTSSHMGD